jgi:hypothetical protein
LIHVIICIKFRLQIKRVKKPRLLQQHHKLYSFNCFVLNDSFSNIFVHQTKRQKKKSQHNIFSLSHRRQKIIFILFSQHNHLFVTLYIYSNILYRCEEEAKNWKMCFFQTGTIRSEVSSLFGVFETFLCGCTCGWYKKESLDSWRCESSGHDPDI